MQSQVMTSRGRIDGSPIGGAPVSPNSFAHEVPNLFSTDYMRPEDIDAMVCGKGVTLLYYRRSIALTLRQIKNLLPPLHISLQLVHARRFDLRDAIRQYEACEELAYTMSDAAWKQFTDALDRCDWNFVEAQVNTRQHLQVVKAVGGRLEAQLEQYTSWSRQAPRKERAEARKLIREVEILLQEFNARLRQAEEDLNVPPVLINEPGLGRHRLRWRVERVIVRNLMRKACEAAREDLHPAQ